MESYLRLHGIRLEEDIDLFVEVIPLLDDIWLEDVNKRQEAEREKKKK